MTEIKDIIYLPDYLRVLCVFHENKNMSVNELHYQYKISYPSLHNMKNVFIDKGWVTVHKSDKKHIVIVTPQGNTVVDAIYNLVDQLGIDREDLLSLKKLNRIHKVKKDGTKNLESKPDSEQNENNSDQTSISIAQEEI